MEEEKKGGGGGGKTTDGGVKGSDGKRGKSGRDGDKEKAKEESGAAIEQTEARSVVDASGSPSDHADEKQVKRKRTADNAATGSHNTAKNAKSDNAESAGDQAGPKSSSRRSARAVTSEDKKSSPGISNAKGGKSRPPAAVNASKRSPKTTGTETKEMGLLEEYRGLRIQLEKLRHRKVYEGEKRRLYAHMLVKLNYEHEVRLAYSEYDAARKLLAQRLLQENMEHQRRVEELRYKIIRDDPHGMWQRRHEMSLRGRNSKDGGGAANPEHGNAGGGNPLSAEADSAFTDGTRQDRGAGSRNRRRVSIDRARVRVELDAGEVMDDLAEIIGDRRGQSDAGASGDASNRSNVGSSNRRAATSRNSSRS